MEAVKSRNQLATGQITGCPENNYDTRVCVPMQTQPFAEWIIVGHTLSISPKDRLRIEAGGVPVCPVCLNVVLDSDVF